MTSLELSEYGIIGIRAANPGPFTLTGTNSWIVGHDPAWLVDPGPALHEHIEALAGAIERRGRLGGIALTHDHVDHAEAVPALRDRYPDAPLAAGRADADIQLSDGDHFGPLEALATPGHSPDHLSFLAGRAALTGDAVLGQGSVFISPYPGALASYMEGLEKLRRCGPEILCPGHGPPVQDVAGKLDEYVAHRLERERRLIEALDAGARRVDALLNEAWSDVPPALRPAATITLAAHLDKLEDEGRLPVGVERPQRWW